MEKVCISTSPALLYAQIGTNGQVHHTVHRRENIRFDDGRIFTFDFDRAEISIEENELLDSYLQVTVRNMDVTVCAGNLLQKFTVSDEIHIATRRRKALQSGRQIH